MELSKNNNKRFYVPQLDGLRFLAFFLVFISHAPSAVPFFQNYPTLSSFIDLIQQNGWVGVDLFLVLSSYLIFSLLLNEKSSTGSVSIGGFYIRRALRIWPLYFPYLFFSLFLYKIVGFASLPDRVIVEHSLPFMFFMGNFSYAYFANDIKPVMSGHLWTVCLEEQFYLFCPIIIYHLNMSSIKKAILIALLIIIFCVSWRIYMYQTQIPYPMVWTNPLCRGDPFVVGGVLALCNHYRPHWISFFKSRLAIAVGLFGLAALMYTQISRPLFGGEYPMVWQLVLSAAICCCILLSALISRDIASLFSLPALRFLGKISYGLYVFHIPAIYIVGKLIRDHTGDLSIKHPELFWFTLTGGILLATICVSAISYYCYERRFIRLKTRYEVIPSRPA